MSEVIGSYFDADVTEVSEIIVIERSTSSRVIEIEFVTDQGVFYEYKDRIRWALQYMNDSSG